MAKTVMAFGSFDILHPGHLLYLKESRRLGSRLVVIVARDRSIEQFKKRKPTFSEKERLLLISSLKMVDEAVLGNRLRGREGMFRIIREYNPDVIALGYDQQADLAGLDLWIKANGLKTRVVRIRSRLDPKRYKSSLIRKRILEN